MKNTGQILKEAREKKGISIAEVSLATKINTRILNAIEQGSLSKLPPKTFLRGFVLSYATFLQLDTDHVMKLFQEEMGSTRPAPEITDTTLTSPPSSERSLESMSRSSNNVAKIAAVVGIILLVVIIILLKKKMESYESETVTPPPVVEEVSPSPTPGDSTPVVDTSPTPSEGASAISMAPLATATPAITPVPTPTPTPKPATPTATPTPTPKPSPTPQPTATPQAAAAPVATPTPKPTPSPTPAARVQDVTIEALDDVDIEAVIDGEGARTIRLKAEQVHTIKARRKVSLRLSDGGAVSIIVNGIDRGVPGDLGKPMKVDIP